MVFGFSPPLALELGQLVQTAEHLLLLHKAAGVDFGVLFESNVFLPA